MSNLIKHAEREFKAAGWDDPADKMQQMMMNNLLDLLQAFADQGHSGFSASYLLNCFDKLAHYKPLAPLTGEDDEWNDVEDNTFQNKRCSEVFKKGKDGTAYWIHGKIFKESNGCTYTSCDSRVDITFPWTMPESEVVEVDDE